MRWLVLTAPEGAYFRRHVMALESIAVPDSEALHHVLCGVDPGLDYSVKFTTTKPRKTSGTVDHGTGFIGENGEMHVRF